jgi:tellurite resistance protein TerC
MTAELAILVGFHAAIGLFLVLDLYVLHRHAHAVGMIEAAVWSGLWVVLALAFAAGVWQCWYLWDPSHPEQGPEKAIEFLTGYLIEKALSVDNLFVFLVIFRYFGVPAPLQHRVLTWGILGAVVLRATLILCGAALLHAFSWTAYLFGAFLIFTAYKLYRSGGERIDPGRNVVLRLARRFLPVVDDYESSRFWVRRQGRWYATPLPLVLLVVESTDLVFATDSIPAVFGITRDPFIVYTSNIFAILGLRALYFLLAHVLDRLRYLGTGLAVVLGLVGLKMLVEEPLRPSLDAAGLGEKERILISLAAVALVLGVTVAASLYAGPEKPVAHEPVPPKAG